MDDAVYAKKTKKLCIIWAVSMVVLGALAIAAIVHGYLHDIHPAPLEPLSTYQIVLTTILVLYICPLLLRIHYCAKRSVNKPIQIASLALLIQHLLWIILAVAENLINK